MLMAARDAACRRYFFASSARLYAVDKQARADLEPLKESDAYQLADIVEEIAGVQLKCRYEVDAPKGVRGRCSDNNLITQVAWMGALNPAARRDGTDLSLDPRSDDSPRIRPSHLRLSPRVNS